MSDDPSPPGTPADEPAHEERTLEPPPSGEVSPGERATDPAAPRGTPTGEGNAEVAGPDSVDGGAPDEGRAAEPRAGQPSQPAAPPGASHPVPYRPPQPPAAPPAGAVAAPLPAPGNGRPTGGETSLTVEYPEESSRLWALLYILFGIKAVVLIVHALILLVLAVGAFVVFVVAQLVVLFTGRMPEGMHRFQTRVIAQNNKLNGWIYGFTDGLPPFMLSDDPYPIETRVGQPETSSRLWALLNILLLKPLALLPHIVILYVLAIASAVVVFVAQIVILVDGQYPRGMFDFVVGVMRWQTRVSAFFYGLRDEYPPFSLG